METLLDECAVGVAAKSCGTLRLSGIVDQSIVDGPGLRLTVFTQGCPHRCAGCHNPSTHSRRGGFAATVESILDRFDANPLLSGITLSGGEPLVQARALLPLARAIRARGKNVWCYTGYTFEEILALPDRGGAVTDLLRRIDVLVDGRYEEERRSLMLQYRGSVNQRVLNVPQSLREGQAVLWAGRALCG